MTSQVNPLADRFMISTALADYLDVRPSTLQTYRSRGDKAPHGFPRRFWTFGTDDHQGRDVYYDRAEAAAYILQATGRQVRWIPPDPET